MKPPKKIIFSVLFSLALSGHAFGQVKPITSGDVLVGENYKAEQSPGQPIVFKDAPEVSTYKMSIQENGDRQYLKTGGPGSFVRDKSFTIIAYGKKPVDENQRFKMFPQNQKLEPGLQWDVAYTGTTKNCGTLFVRYRGTSKIGPDFSVTVDGKEAKLKTIQVDLDGSSTHSCNTTYKLDHNILYSPELNEIVAQKFIDLEASYLFAGFNRILKSVQTRGGTVGAEESTETK
jgi:hypothetical protein